MGGTGDEVQVPDCIGDWTMVAYGPAPCDT